MEQISFLRSHLYMGPEKNKKAIDARITPAAMANPVIIIALL